MAQLTESTQYYMSTFYIIWLKHSIRQSFPDDISSIISKNTVFSGGYFQHEAVQSFLPETAVWIEIKAPFDNIFTVYKDFIHEDLDIVVFVSDDPIYLGFTTAVSHYLPHVQVKEFRVHDLLYKLAQHLMIRFQGMFCVDFADSSWHDLDYAVIKGKSKIGILTNKTYTPSIISERLMDYGYTNYMMYAGEHLDDPKARNVRKLSLVSASSGHYDHPDCIILLKEHEHQAQPLGIPDHYFSRIPDQEMKITPRAVRLLALSMLELKHRRRFWDIGFCTGSMAIEAKLQYPHLHVTGFDRDEECGKLLAINSCRCGTPGIQSVIGDFCDADLILLEQPDAVFIGGHGGKIIEIISRLVHIMTPDGIIVFCSLNEESNVFFLHAATQYHLQVLEKNRIAIDDYEPCTVFKAVPLK